MTDIGKIVGKLWSQEISDADKQPYYDLAEQDKERFGREIAEEMKANNGKRLMTAGDLK